ncbi:hypothetical protein [Mycoplasma seminis]|uniref:Uncharacterized protein n=1 Tax=Mycoplasma seminis TaxID=512749 RepID=A0ABY9HAI7_9MOLU|nr:hypothetical protein [Mycoplasma seminis]WLP85612.1 hypothetical protein Q8852_00385 [Mycoplasma seminis]
MGSVVKAHCPDCDYTYTYVFGLVQDLMPFQMFLNLYAKKQKDLFNKEIFKEVMYEELETDLMFMLKEKNEQEQILEKNFENINNFFSAEEKQIIKSNIVMGGELESYPVFRMDQAPEKREIFNIPLVKILIMGSEPYNRKYNPAVYYVQFSEDHSRLTCPRHGDKRAEFVSEEQY